ncbi:MAG: PrsW family intramembrane metalloprotease [Anaerolineales bacterium]
MEILLLPVLSFAPMFFYALLLWWLDRYEKEPLHLLAFAFLWGAVPAIILSLILELALEIPILALNSPQLAQDLLGTAVAAPIVEEIAKALALLTLLIFFRLEIDSPLDGLIYGGMAGFGFAAVENFFYFFAVYFEAGLSGLLTLTFLRAGLFGLNHAMFTAFTGLGLALALEVRERWIRALLPLLGLSLAIGAHAFHNSFATFWMYVEGDAPLVAAFVGDGFGVLLLLAVAVWARLLEQKRISAFLESAPAERLIPTTELPIFTSTWRRWGARLSALLRGDVSRWWYLGRYFQLVAEAAFNWHRARRGDLKSKVKFTEIQQKLHTLRKLHLSGTPALF